MSIATRTGDTGTTALMFNRRVPKYHPRVVAGGAVDELSAALGLARASADDVGVAAILFAEQKCLVGLMAELATADADRPRLLESKLQRLQPEDLSRLDELVAKLEANSAPPRGWDTPGENAHHAHLHLARAVCRRAEREVVALRATGEHVPDLVLQYLNRLSDALWLLAQAKQIATIVNTAKRYQFSKMRALAQKIARDKDALSLTPLQLANRYKLARASGYKLHKLIH